MQERNELLKKLRDLFASQRSAVLATSEGGQPYCSLMAFAAAENLAEFYLVTLRHTRKYANIAANPKVSLLVDNRSNRETDVQEALAVTATGKAEALASSQRDAALNIFLARQPQLSDFAASPDCAVITIKVDRFVVVRRFQEVTELDLS